MSDQTAERLLDATRASIADFGIRRTSLTDVARRAGVSRMTVYRRYPDLDALIRDLMTREFGALMEEAAAQATGGDGRERLVAQVLASVRALRDHPVLRKVLEAEPELLLPYLVAHLGGSQRHALELLDASILAGQADGSIRDGDPRVMAAGLMLVTQSFLLSAPTVEDVALADLDAELERTVRASLAP